MLKAGGITRVSNMDPVFINTGKAITLEAIVYPECECGKPWAVHGDCGGYKPAKPIINYGTIYFVSNDWLANTLFAVERFFQRLRVARLRRV